VQSPGPAHMYVVVNLTTLLGLDNDPTYLDGQGLIGADTARKLLTEARRAYVTRRKETRQPPLPATGPPADSAR